MDILSTVSRKCLEALTVARETIQAQGEQGRTSVPAEKDEPVTKLDLAVSTALKEFFLGSGLIASYTSEEAGEIHSGHTRPDYAIFWDEVDGTFNYERGGLLNSSAVITAFDAANPLRFKDAIFAGVLDLGSGDLWFAERGKGCYLNGEKVRSFGKKELDGRKTYLFLDHGPCPEEGSAADPLRFTQIYRTTWPHNISSAGIHFASVASGNADAAILPIQKAHELGAGYLLVTEAGRYIADFRGTSLDDQEFEFSRTYEIIAADTKELAQELLAKIY